MKEIVEQLTPFAFDYNRKEALWLLFIVPAMLLWHLHRRSVGKRAVQISSIQHFRPAMSRTLTLYRHLHFLLWSAGVTCLILALAKPRSPQEEAAYREKNKEGIDVVIAMDVSGSMLAEDLRPNRLEAAKQVATQFIDERPNDRIGLVVYEGEAYTQSPLTTDHALLKTQMARAQTGIVTEGTAIGLGLITAVNRLIESSAKSKVVILMTDGLNNAGDIPPLDAAKAAKEMGVCVYTIGIGREGTAPMPLFGGMTTAVPVAIDEQLLTAIAQMTGGNYYRAKSKTELQQIYQAIDQLEKSKVEVIAFRAEPPDQYLGFLGLGIALLLLHRLIAYTFLKRIP